MWPNRPKRSPKWPTFRGADFKGTHPYLNIYSDFKRILDEEGKVGKFKLISISTGSQYVRENKNGGFVNGGGSRNEYNTLHFELQAYVQKKAGRRSPLYLIGWVGGYGKGSILHMSWQYPHCKDFEEEDIERASLEAYVEIAKMVYRDRPMDREVAKFIREVEGGLR